MKKAGITVSVIVGVVALIILGVILDVGGIRYRGFLSKEKAKVERKVFKETQSFNEGMEQQLLKLLLERAEKKAAGDLEGMVALDFTIQHRYATYNEKNIDSPRLRAMLEEVKYGVATTQY
jgi:hypothetical protein